MALTGIDRTFQPKAENIFFSSTQETFSRLDQMIGYKRSLNKFKKIGTVSSIFSNHIDKKLETNYKKTEQFTNVWRLNSMPLNNQ